MGMQNVFILFIYFIISLKNIQYINNNSDSWLIMLMQQDLEGHELLH